MRLRQRLVAVVVAAICLLSSYVAAAAAAAATAATAPQNVTVTCVDSRTVHVSWSTAANLTIDKFDVSYKPTEANFRVVTVVAGNSAEVTLADLEPDTQYQVTVAAIVRGGARARSRPIVFRTPADTSSDTMPATTLVPFAADELNPDPTAIGSRYTPVTSITVRGVEVSLVLLALVVWVFAITLFFHRWGKIRMLLPYQPDYKTQQSLKVPGSGAGLAGCTADGSGHSDARTCVQQLRWSSRYFDDPARPPSRWASRSRLPSGAISGSCTSLVLSVPTLHQQPRSARSSLASIIDCLRRPTQTAEMADAAETQPLFVIEPAQSIATAESHTTTAVVSASAIEETPLMATSPPQSTVTAGTRYHRSSLRKQKTSLSQQHPQQQLLQPSMAERRRKTLQRKISLQDTYINYNQDYWLQYDRSARFHTSLDLGYFCKNMPDQGPKTTNTIKAITSQQPQQEPRQSESSQRAKPRKFLRGDSEPFIRLPQAIMARSPPQPHASTSSPSNENIPLFCERNGNIELDFHRLDSEASDSDDSFSDIIMNGGSRAFFEPVLSSSNDSVTCEEQFFLTGQRRRASVPLVSITRPSNSPSPLASISPVISAQEQPSSG